MILTSDHFFSRILLLNSFWILSKIVFINKDFSESLFILLYCLRTPINNLSASPALKHSINNESYVFSISFSICFSIHLAFPIFNSMEVPTVLIIVITKKTYNTIKNKKSSCQIILISSCRLINNLFLAKKIVKNGIIPNDKIKKEKQFDLLNWYENDLFKI